MFMKLLNAGQWATVLDTLRRAAALSGVELVDSRLGLSLVRAAVRSGAGEAALQSCLQVAPREQAMHVVLLHHYRATRNLEVRALVPKKKLLKLVSDKAKESLRISIRKS